MLFSLRSSVSVMAARWVAVTLAQSVTPVILARSASRTASVRAQMPRSRTVMSNSSLIDPPLPSLAVTFTDTVPVSAVAGVPAKVRVLSVKASHVGSVVSSAFVAA